MWKRRTLVDVARDALVDAPVSEGDLIEVTSVAILRDEIERAEALLAQAVSGVTRS